MASGKADHWPEQVTICASIAVFACKYWHWKKLRKPRNKETHVENIPNKSFPTEELRGELDLRSTAVWMANARQQVHVLFTPEAQPQNLVSVTHHKTQNQYQKTVMERTERISKSSVVTGKCELSNIEPWSKIFYLERCRISQSISTGKKNPRSSQASLRYACSLKVVLLFL